MPGPDSGLVSKPQAVQMFQVVAILLGSGRRLGGHLGGGGLSGLLRARDARQEELGGRAAREGGGERERLLQPDARLQQLVGDVPLFRIRGVVVFFWSLGVLILLWLLGLSVLGLFWLFS